MPEETAGPYPADGSTASNARNKVKTTQLAFPTTLRSSIYSSNAGYSASAHNLSAMAFATDNLFSDGTALEITTLQANTGGGYTTSVTISIAA